MITTVTTTTVMSAVALGAGLGVVAVIALIVLLIAKELSSAEGDGKNEKLKNLASILTIPIVSLMLVFMVIVATKIWEVL